VGYRGFELRAAATLPHVFAVYQFCTFRESSTTTAAVAGARTSANTIASGIANPGAKPKNRTPESEPTSGV
jgi:hypothetical protein